MMLASMAQIRDATFQIEQSMEGALPGTLLPLQVQDSYRLEFRTINGLGPLDPPHLGSMFPLG